MLEFHDVVREYMMTPIEVLDSVGLLTLVVDLEDHFRVALKEEDAAVIRTVAELAALVLRRREEAAAC